MHYRVSDRTTPFSPDSVSYSTAPTKCFGFLDEDENKKQKTNKYYSTVTNIYVKLLLTLTKAFNENDVKSHVRAFRTVVLL